MTKIRLARQINQTIHNGIEPVLAQLQDETVNNPKILRAHVNSDGTNVATARSGSEELPQRPPNFSQKRLYNIHFFH